MAKDNLKICFLSKSLNPRTGYGSFASSLIGALVKKNNFEAAVLVQKDEGVFFGEKPVLFKVRAGIFLNPFIIKKYSKNCDVIHALDGYPYGIYAVLAGLLTRKKIVVTMQGTYAVEPLYMGVRKNLLSWAYKRSQGLTAISDFTKKEVLKVIPELSGRIEVINHGVNFQELVQSEDGKRPMEEKYILSVGAITERKGYHISLRAFAKIKKDFPNLKYVIVGAVNSGGYQQTLNKIIKENNLGKDVVFVGQPNKDELAGWYRNAELFLLPSVNVGHHFEGFGLVFLEAGVYGLPVVGALGSGAEDAVKNNKTGILVPQNNPEKTAQALIQILKDKSFRDKLGQNNFEFSRSRTWSLVAEEYLNFYKNII